jgi:glycine oxidase
MTSVSERRVIIIGGGVIGLAIAWRLLKDGARVAIADAGKSMPAATEAAAGMLAPSFEHGSDRLARAQYRFGADSLVRWKTFAGELERDAAMSIDYRPFGIMGPAFNARFEAALKASAEKLAERGAHVEWLDAREARRREPALAGTLVGAVFAHDDAQVDPRLVRAALQRVVAKGGGEFIAARVKRVAHAGGAVTGIVVDGDAEIAADVVVAATGAFPFKAVEGMVSPVFPEKGEALSLDARDIPLTSVIWAPGAYMCPKAGGRLIVGATAAPEDRTPDPSPSRLEELKRAAFEAVPGLAGCPELERWAGFRPATLDGAPVIGADTRGPAGLYVAIGHYRNGVLLAPETAYAVAGLILCGESPGVIAPFSPERFTGEAGS